LWEFGKVEMQEVTPALLIRTRRPNRTVVYVNICSCVSVPYNKKIMEDPNSIIYMVLGESGLTANDHTVYDIAVNGAVINAAKLNKEIMTKVSVKICCFH
jgi:riboflavin synthase